MISLSYHNRNMLNVGSFRCTNKSKGVSNSRLGMGGWLCACACVLERAERWDQGTMDKYVCVFVKLYILNVVYLDI